MPAVESGPDFSYLCSLFVLFKKGGKDETIGRRIPVPVDAAERQGRKGGGARKTAGGNKEDAAHQG